MRGAKRTLLKQVNVKGVVPGAQILAVAKDEAGAEDAKFQLCAGVEEPHVRAELRAGVGDLADVEERAELELDDARCYRRFCRSPSFREGNYDPAGALPLRPSRVPMWARRGKSLSRSSPRMNNSSKGGWPKVLPARSCCEVS